MDYNYITRPCCWWQTRKCKLAGPVCKVWFPKQSLGTFKWWNMYQAGQIDFKCIMLNVYELKSSLHQITSSFQASDDDGKQNMDQRSGIQTCMELWDFLKLIRGVISEMSNDEQGFQKLACYQLLSSFLFLGMLRMFCAACLFMWGNNDNRLLRAIHELILLCRSYFRIFWITLRGPWQMGFFYKKHVIISFLLRYFNIWE